MSRLFEPDQEIISPLKTNTVHIYVCTHDACVCVREVIYVLRQTHCDI